MTEAEGEWQVLVGVPYRYVTWQSEDDGVTAWDEIDDAVRAYEQTYGVVPEAPFSGEILSSLATVSPLEFVDRWFAARNAL